MLKQYIPKLYSDLLILIGLRFKNDACKTLLFNCKESLPLWFDIATQFVHISSFLINPDLYKKQENISSFTKAVPFNDISESDSQSSVVPQPNSAESPIEPPSSQPSSGTLPKDSPKKLAPNTLISSPVKSPVKKNLRIAASESDESEGEGNPREDRKELQVLSPKFPERIRSISSDSELHEVVWSQTIKIVKEILKINESSVASLEKHLIEEVIKKSQDMDMNMMNFILKTLLPSSKNAGKERQEELISLIDNGCNLNYASLSASSSRPGNDQLSKFCIYTLIDLCQAEEKEAGDGADMSFKEIKMRIAGMATPVFINRCKAIIAKYLNDEKRNGLVPLPK